ncbi:MAG: hypothetical protein R3B36_01890 [Polyangiaceae bacterium]
MLKVTATSFTGARGPASLPASAADPEDDPPEDEPPEDELELVAPPDDDVPGAAPGGAPSPSPPLPPHAAARRM